MRVIKQTTKIEFDFDDICDILVEYARINMERHHKGVNPNFRILDVTQDAGNFTIYVTDD